MHKEKNILLVGGGDFAKKVIKLLSQDYDCNIIGYTDLEDKGTLFGVKYLGRDEISKKLIDKDPKLSVVICLVGDYQLLKKKNILINYYRSLGFSFPTIISKKSYIDDDSVIGEGVVVFDNVYIDFNVKVSDFCILNLGAMICHDVKIGSNVVISPRTVISGGVKVSPDVFIGANSTINPYLKVDSNVIIGSGSTVNKSIENSGTYVGNPLRKVK